MGIHGLLPFLKKASRQSNIKEFKGCTVAIDSYCWLHRGAFACAEKLALGEKTDQYVYYCMKYINNLLSFGIKPIMVFDGCRLPSKQEVEKTRRDRRALNRKKAAQLLLEGKRSEARDCLAQCIDITPQMALELINACREKGVDCIVAPYEADAQLAYLNKCGIAQLVITEDSDLVLFGCDRIMFKMDISGNGTLIEQWHINKAMGLHPDAYTFDKFRYACILSGCDYVASLPGIGLAKATKVFRLSRQTDIATLIKKMPSLLKMPGLPVTVDYVDAFFRANNSFLYQLVFDPLNRRLVPLNPYPDDIDPAELHYAGPYISDEKALQIALGNVNVNTGERLADFDPDTAIQLRSAGWNVSTDVPPHLRSIWSRLYQPLAEPFKSTCDLQPIERPSTRGREVVVKLSGLKLTGVKRQRSDDTVPPVEEIVSMYSKPLPTDRSAVTDSTSDNVSNADDVRELIPSKKRRRRCLSECDINGDIQNYEMTHNDDDGAVVTDGGATDAVPTCSTIPVIPQSSQKQFNKENYAAAMSNSSATAANSDGDTLKSPSPVFKSPPQRRNVFAQSRDGSIAVHRQRFNVNATKDKIASPEPAVEVRSRFFVPKSARRESEFFKELKKQDLCEREVESRDHADDDTDCNSDESCEEREKDDGHDTVVTQLCDYDDIQQLTPQHLTDDEPHPTIPNTTTAIATAADAVTASTSLQSCLSLSSDTNHHHPDKLQHWFSLFRVKSSHQDIASRQLPVHTAAVSQPFKPVGHNPYSGTLLESSVSFSHNSLPLHRVSSELLPPASPASPFTVSPKTSSSESPLLVERTTQDCLAWKCVSSECPLPSMSGVSDESGSEEDPALESKHHSTNTLHDCSDEKDTAVNCCRAPVAKLSSAARISLALSKSKVPQSDTDIEHRDVSSQRCNIAPTTRIAMAVAAQTTKLGRRLSALMHNNRLRQHSSSALSSQQQTPSSSSKCRASGLSKLKCNSSSSQSKVQSDGIGQKDISAYFRNSFAFQKRSSDVVNV